MYTFCFQFTKRKALSIWKHVSSQLSLMILFFSKLFICYLFAIWNSESYLSIINSCISTFQSFLKLIMCFCFHFLICIWQIFNADNFATIISSLLNKTFTVIYSSFTCLMFCSCMSFYLVLIVSTLLHFDFIPWYIFDKLFMMHILSSVQSDHLL